MNMQIPNLLRLCGKKVYKSFSFYLLFLAYSLFMSKFLALTLTQVIVSWYDGGTQNTANINNLDSSGLQITNFMSNSQQAIITKVGMKFISALSKFQPHQKQI